MALAEEGAVAKRVELLLRLAHERVEPCLHVGQLVADVVHEDLRARAGRTQSVDCTLSFTGGGACREPHLVESLGEELCPAAVRNVAVPGVSPEEVLLAPELLVHGLLRVDVLLTPPDDADEAELERVDPPRQDVGRVRARVHEVELGQDADRATPLRVDCPRELERLGVGEVDVGGRDGQDDAAPSLSACSIRQSTLVPALPASEARVALTSWAC